MTPDFKTRNTKPFQRRNATVWNRSCVRNGNRFSRIDAINDVIAASEARKGHVYDANGRHYLCIAATLSALVRCLHGALGCNGIIAACFRTKPLSASQKMLQQYRDDENDTWLNSATWINRNITLLHDKRRPRHRVHISLIAQQSRYIVLPEPTEDKYIEVSVFYLIITYLLNTDGPPK